MNIEHIYIDSFGKFNKFELDLGNNLNVVYGNNEDGKSTIMAFARMMFYGDSSRSQNIREKLRALYRPWHSDRMAGSITFAAAGKRYQLDRVFGKTNSADKIKITDLGTGSEVQLARNEEPGQRFFDLGLEAFEKSVFIGQNNSMISGTGKDDEIMQKLLNMVTTGDENTSYKRVSANLDVARFQLQSKSKNKGLLPEAVSKLASLQSERERAVEDERAKVAAYDEITRMQVDKQELITEREHLKTQLSSSRLQAERQQLERKINLRRELEKLLAEQAKLRIELERDEVVLDSNYIEEAEKKITKHTNISNSLREAEEQQKQAKSELDELGRKNLKEIPDGRTEQLRQLERKAEDIDRELGLLADEISRLEELSQIEQELITLTEELQAKREASIALQTEEKELDEELKKLKSQKAVKLSGQKSLREQLSKADVAKNTAMLALNNAGNSVQSVKDRYEIRLEIAKEQLEKARQPQEYQEQIPASREVKKPILAAGIAVAILAAVLGIIVNPFLWLLIIAAAFLLVFSAQKLPARTISKRIVDNNMVERLQKELNTLEGQMEEDVELAQAEVDKAQQQKEQTEQEYVGIETELKQIEPELEKLDQQLLYIDEKHDIKKSQVTMAEAGCDELDRRIDSRIRLVADKRQLIENKQATRMAASFALEASVSGQDQQLDLPDEQDISELSDISETAEQLETPDVLQLSGADSAVITEKQLIETRQHENKLKEYRCKLAEDIAAGLAEFEVTELDELYQIEKIWTSHAQQLKIQEAACDNATGRVKALKTQLENIEQETLNFISLYKPAITLEQALINLDEIEQHLDKLTSLASEIRGYRNSLAGDEDATIEELERQYNSLTERINAQIKLKTQTNSAADSAPADNQADSAPAANEAFSAPGDNEASEAESISPEELDAEIAKLEFSITEISNIIASHEATVREKYRKRRNVSQIDDEIDRLTEKVDRMRTDLDILGSAAAVMEEAFQEVQRSFGPLVNKKTAEIFERLTQGKYCNVMVSRDFAITFENSRDRMLKEWGYLSSGTIDQAYLALRLAITDLVTDGGEPLPLLLDDIFTLYDDDRAYEGMQFISNYRRDEDIEQQVLLFTCHRRIAEWGDNLGANSIDLTKWSS